MVVLGRRRRRRVQRQIAGTNATQAWCNVHPLASSPGLRWLGVVVMVVMVVVVMIEMGVRMGVDGGARVVVAVATARL